MAWFFTENPLKEKFHIITGENARHIEKSLRMKTGEQITLVDNTCMQYECEIETVSQENVSVKILRRFPCQNEPDVRITLYQALPKGEKMDFIIQKAVELGVTEIIPTISARCISRPDPKSLQKKIQRWNKIALQSAQQSRRGIIPKVKDAMTFSQAAETLDESNCNIIFYECGGKRIGDILSQNSNHKDIHIFIGSEGGFEDREVNQVIDRNGTPATLGKRILRCETAPLCAISIIMYLTGNA